MADISSWGLQLCIVKNYWEMGISKLFNWQTECLNAPGVLDGKNLVFSAPTSAGKTLIVEILLLKRIQITGKKVIFILPYVSLVKEKMFSLQQLVEGTGIRVDGYMGGASISNDFSSIDVAICTIEKANNLINRLIEEEKLHKLGMVVVDELHMVSDKSRGYLLELLLTKVRFLSLCKAKTLSQDIKLQIVGMSATVPNLNLLSDWLDATLYQTSFRPVPLQRCVKIGNNIFDEDFTKLRTFVPSVQFYDDQSDLTSLCHETLMEGDSVLIFCPTKHWCEKLSNLIARNFYHLNSNPLEQKQYVKLNMIELQRIIDHLERLPSGLDETLKLTIPFSVAYHHAGLTVEERDVIENGFRRSFIRVLVATSTLSSGVNLPAKRVIIRTPMFHRNVINPLSYQQMAGRAGRKGKNQSGESILICQPSERKKVEVLCQIQLPSLKSCLNSTPNTPVTKSMKRAILEIIVNGIACKVGDIFLYITCTLLSSQLKHELKPGGEKETIDIEIIKECLLWLKEYEFIYMESNWDSTSQNKDILNAKLSASQFGRAALLSSLPTYEALQVLADLRMASKNLVLDSELHLVYQITPLNSLNEWHNLNWMDYLRIYEGLPNCLLQVAEIIGINEGFITRIATSGNTMFNGKLSEKRLRQLNIHTRFYSALALYDLVNEFPLDVTCQKFNCNRGMLQSLQHSASSFAGMVTTFCQQLGWWSLELLFKEFQCRLVFGVQHELVDLTKDNISVLKREYARLLYDNGYKTCELLACANAEHIASILRNSTKFQSNRKDVLNNHFCASNKIKTNGIMMFGSNTCLNEEEAAIKFIHQAQILHPLFNDAITRVNQKCESTFSSQAFLQQLSQNVPQQQPYYSDENENNYTNDAQRCNGGENGNDDIFLTFTTSFEKGSGNLFNLPSETSPHLNNNNETFDFTFDNSDRNSCKSITYSSASSSPDILKSKMYENNKERISTESSKESPNANNDKNEVNQVNYRNSVTEFQEVCNYEKGSTQIDEKLEPFKENSPIKDIGNRLILNKNAVSEILGKSQNFVKDTSLFCEFTTPKEGKHLKTCNLKKEVHLGSNHNNNPYTVLSSTPILNIPSCQVKYAKTVNNSNDMLGNKSANISNLSELFSKSVSLNEISDNTSCDLFNGSIKENDIQRKSPLEKSTGLETSLNNMHLNCNLKLKKSGKLKRMLFSEVIVNVCATEELFFVFIQEWAKQKNVGISLIKDNEDVKGKTILDAVKGIAVSWNPKTCFYISLKKDESSPISLENRVSNISKILNSCKNWTYVGHNIKEQIKLILIRFEIFLFRKWKDSYIADWLLNPDLLNLNFEGLMKKYCANYANITNDITNNPELTEVKLGCRKALLSLNSVLTMDKLMTEHNMLNAYENIEIPHIISLSILEINGIGIDIKTFKTYNKKLFKYMRELQNDAWKIAGHKFNLNSPIEVAKILYGELGLKPSTEMFQSFNLKKSSHYKYWGTNKAVLTELTEQTNPHPLPRVIMQWRSLHYSMYKVLHPISSVVNLDLENIQFFTASCIACTSTGRISMNEPNIQNIPKSYTINLQRENLKSKTDDKNIQEICLRNIFVPNSGNVFISADYSQLELRILGHMSKDNLLLSTLNRSDGVDVFKLIAVSVCENITNTDDVTIEKRQIAKQICYGIIYGMGAKCLSKQIKKSETVAANFIEDFLKKYSKVSVFLQNVVRRCRENGYITTLSGRRRYLPDIKSVKIDLRGHAERQAVNSVIQGSAADLVKSATNAIIKESYERKWNILRHKNKSASVSENCYFVHQIHDELIFEVSHSMVHEVCLLMSKCMTTCIPLHVKLKANFKIGPSWGQLENYEFSS